MRRLIAALALVALPTVLSAQQQQGTPANSPRRSAPATAAAEALTAVRGRLLLLVESQEAHFADHGSYTKDLVALQLSGKGQARSPVILDVTHAGRRAWRAIGWHSAHPSKTCVTFVGKAADLPLPATKMGRQPTAVQEGQAVCDDP